MITIAQCVTVDRVIAASLATISVSGTTLVYSGGGSTAHNITIFDHGDMIRTYSSGHDISAETGCIQISASIVDCPIASLTGVQVSGSTAADHFRLVTTLAATINGASENDTLIIHGTSDANDQTIDANTITRNGHGTVALTSVENIELHAGDGDDVLTAQNIAASQVVTMCGGADGDSLTAQGTVDGAVTLDGGTGNDSIVNNTTGSGITYIFGGGGSNSINNQSGLVGGINFGSSSETCLSFSFDCINVTEIPLNECEALLALYASTNGANWTNNTNWLQTNTPCSWYGIICANDQITQIDLSSNNVRGDLSSNFGGLSSLRFLYLEANYLTMVPNFSTLSSLRRLHLSFNELTTVPNFDDLSSLTGLYLNNNKLATVPSFNSLPALAELNLANNELATVPNFSGLSNLTELHISGNQLTTAPDFSDLSSLIWLYMSHNQELVGEIPNTYTSLDLERFYFSQTQLCEPQDATFQNWLTAIPSLGRTNIPCNEPPIAELEADADEGNTPLEITFDASGSSDSDNGDSIDKYQFVFGNGETLITTTAQVQHTYINTFTAKSVTYTATLTVYDSHGAASQNTTQQTITVLPESGFDCFGIIEIPFGECEALVALYINTNGDNWTDNTNWLQTNVPCNWNGVVCIEGHVRGIYLGNTGLVGAIPSKIDQFTDLEHLYLNTNQLHGSIPLELGQLTNLIYLYLNENELSGNIPSNLGQLVNLKRLSLHTNQLNGSIPSELGQLTTLEWLSLSANELSGGIPSELGQLANLQWMYLNSNELSGSIPSELGQLTNLKTLVFFYNQLSGNIPSELSQLTNLQELSLISNRLNGDIPSELGQLANLQQLHLSYNELSGRLPHELGQLANLQQLYLDANQFDGNLPSTIAQLTNLERLYLNDNSLTGVIPNQYTNLSLSRFYFDDTELCEPQDAVFQEWLDNIPNLRRTNISCVTTDDSCGGANEVVPDGAVRQFAFETEGDVDWMRFEAMGGTRYEVRGDVPPGSSVDLIFEVYTECDDEIWIEQYPSFSPDVQLQFTAVMTGTHYLRLSNDGEDFGEETTYDLTVTNLDEQIEIGAAILIGGREKWSDRLQDDIHHVMHTMYGYLRAVGYEEDDLLYIASPAETSAFKKRDATIVEVGEAITTWAAERISDKKPLTLYIISHGLTDRFYLDGVRGYQITTDQLDSWLTILEDAVTAEYGSPPPINIIIETCYSGSFIKHSDSLSKPNRVVISSTGESNLAYVECHDCARKGAKFSNKFIDMLTRGVTLEAAFLKAQQHALYETRHFLVYGQQTPWLDDNGDGYYDPSMDGHVAAQRRLGAVGGLGDSWEPYIPAIAPIDETNGGVTLQAEVRDNNGVKRVWAVLYPPSYTPPVSQTGFVVADLPVIELTADPVRNRGAHVTTGLTYTGVYTPLIEVGTYRAIVYAEDNAGLLASPEAISFYNATAIVPTQITMSTMGLSSTGHHLLALIMSVVFIGTIGSVVYWRKNERGV